MIYDPYCEPESPVNTPGEPAINSTLAEESAHARDSKPSRRHDSAQAADVEAEHFGTENGTLRVDNETSNKLTDKLKRHGIVFPGVKHFTLDDGTVPDAWEANDDCGMILYEPVFGGGCANVY